MLAEQDDQRLEDHPVEPDEIVALARKGYEYGQTNLPRLYARCMESYLWYAGQHHLRIDETTRRFVRIEQTRRVPRPVINLVQEKVESITGDLNKGVVAGHVVPNSEDIRDRLGARAADKIREHKWELDKMDSVQRGVIQGSVICGDMFTETEIDNSATNKVEYQGPDGRTMSLSLADATTNPLLPVQVFPNPGATTLRDARWIHIHVLKSMDWVKENWPHVRDVAGADAQSNPIAVWQNRLTELMLYESSPSGYGSLWNRGTGAWQSVEEQVILHKIQFPPSKYYPQGRLFIVAGGGVCWGGPLPLGELMVTHYRYSPVENSFWSMGLVQALIPLNKHVEASVAQTTLARKVAAVPMFFTPLRSGGSFAEDELRVEVGGVYKYRPGPRGEKPEIVQGRHPADAGYVADMELFMSEFFERVSGSKDVLVGERPQGITAGVALRQLIQRASVRFAPKVSAALKHNEEMEEYRLKAIAQAPAWVMPRRIGLPGRAGRLSFGFFRAGDMRDNYTYRIESEAKGLQDEATIAQLTMDAIGNGLINLMDPMVASRNRMKALEKIGLGGAGYVDTESVDIHHGELNLARVLDGEEFEPGPFDNYAIHYQVFLEFIKTEEYLLLDETLRESVDRYTVLLQQMIQIQAIGAMMRQSRLDDAAEQVAGPPGPPPMPGEAPAEGGPGAPSAQAGGSAGPPGAGAGGPPRGGGPPQRPAKSPAVAARGAPQQGMRGPTRAVA